MLFNSYEFIFGFLPVVLVGFYLLGARRRDWALLWLTLASLGFYAWWRPINVLLIAPSILINLGLARLLERHREARPSLARAVLICGIAFNLCFLGYFKYTMFLRGAVNDVFGTSLVLTHIILPLGISFITFQKIAFLADVHAGRVTAFTFRDYALFVLFFPQLIAGPIVHYREMMPQFRAITARFNAEDAAVGVTLFSMGLAKKLILADPMALVVSPLYARAQHGGALGFVDGWIAALGFYVADLFRFFRLHRHGTRPGAVLWHQTAGQFQFAFEGGEHHRILAALARQSDAIPDRVYLQPAEPLSRPQADGGRQARLRRARHHRGDRSSRCCCCRRCSRCSCPGCGMARATPTSSGVCCMGRCSPSITHGGCSGRGFGRVPRIIGGCSPAPVSC